MCWSASGSPDGRRRPWLRPGVRQRCGEVPPRAEVAAGGGVVQPRAVHRRATGRGATLSQAWFVGGRVPASLCEIMHGGHTSHYLSL